MRFTADWLLRRLAELESGTSASRYLVAYSGGLDSSVLLHALATSRERLSATLLAVHCHHGLQAEADAWETHCVRFASTLEVPLEVRRLRIDARDPRGVEAAAREARYAALRALAEEGDMVLSAHHQDDQAETLLLNLLRGSGPGGVAGIGAVQAFGPARLCRPLLDVPRSSLRDYARDARLSWVDDPTNADPRFDRNWLRREIMPRLSARWPAAAAGLRRSAELASEAQALQNELADLDLAALAPAVGPPVTLDMAGLRRLSPARRRNLLRRALALSGLPPAPAKRLIEAAGRLVAAAPDSQPLVGWPGAEMRRYRDRLFLLRSPLPAPPAEPLLLPGDGSALRLGPRLGSLRLVQGPAGGIDRGRVGAGLKVRFRAGGERLRPRGRRETHRLKQLLQEAGILPWMRASIPLLYADASLVAVADLWIEEAAWRPDGLAVRWDGRPPLT